MQKTIILLTVSCAMFMEAVDTTVINTAIPVMAASLKVNPLDLKLALISYLLSLAIFIPISGWLADKFGIKKIFIIALGIFTLSSLYCGFSYSLSELVVARVLQGLGGSLTLPLGRLIILRTSEKHELISRMSLVVMIAAIGMMLGPLLGGIIITHFSWRWIFWINIPVGVLSIIFSIKLLPQMPPRKVPPLDKIGFILFGSGLALLTFSLAAFSESDIQIIQSVFTLLLAVALLVAYARHSYTKKHPLVKIKLLQTRSFRIAVIGNLLARLGFGGIPFLLPLMLQVALGFSPRLAGALLVPIALGVLTVKPTSLYVLRSLGYKKLLIINTILISLAVAAFALINQNSSVYKIGFFTFLYGFLISLQYTGMNSLAFANIEEEDISGATSIMSTIQQLAQSFGVAISAILVSFFSYELSQPILSISIFRKTFVSLAGLTFLSGLIFMSLKKEDGHELIDKPSVKME